jgi:CheY-like chemotaxis protein
VAHLNPTEFAAAPHNAAASVGIRLLLVEDDASIRSALGDMLEDEGFTVTTAVNGREALDVLHHGPPPEVIVLDLMMPVMDGWDFRAEQLKDPAIRETPVIVLTATGFSRRTIREQFGGVECLPKPLPTDDLLDTLRRVCTPH